MPSLVQCPTPIVEGDRDKDPEDDVPALAPHQQPHQQRIMSKSSAATSALDMDLGSRSIVVLTLSGGSPYIGTNPRTGKVRSRLGVLVMRAINWILLFFADWLGARRFDSSQEDDEVSLDVVVPIDGICSRSTRALIRENFQCRSKSGLSSFSIRSFFLSRSSPAFIESGNIRSASEEGGRTAAPTGVVPTPPSVLGRLSGVRAELRDCARGVSETIECVADLTASQYSGSRAVESMMWQHWPIFIMTENVVVLGLWLAAANQDGWPDEVAGLDSFWFGQTCLRMHTDCDDHRGEVWRWFTYQFSHYGFPHLAINLFTNTFAGIPLEGFQGHLRLLFIFNLGVFGGACAHLLDDVHARSLVGMSAGVYALMGMHLADLVMNWRQCRFRKHKLFVLLVLAVADIIHAHFTLDSQADGARGSIPGNASHLGGYTVGLIAGTLLCRNLRVKPHERVIQMTSCTMGVAIGVFSVVWAMQWPPRTIWDPTPWCWARQVYNATVFVDGAWHCVRCQNLDCISEWAHQQWIAPVHYRECT